MSIREGYLHDYVAGAIVGGSVGLFLSVTMGGFYAGIGMLFVGSLIGNLAGGFAAGYLNFRFHRVSENLEMAGLTAGFVAAIVGLIIILIEFANDVIRLGYNTDLGISLALSIVLAFIFFSAGGYVAGIFERKQIVLPPLLDFSHRKIALPRLKREPSVPPPPPPPETAQLCHTCGKPLTYISEYNRWYCYNEQKYA